MLICSFSFSFSSVAAFALPSLSARRSIRSNACAPCAPAPKWKTWSESRQASSVGTRPDGPQLLLLLRVAQRRLASLGLPVCVERGSAAIPARDDLSSSSLRRTSFSSSSCPSSPSAAWAGLVATKTKFGGALAGAHKSSAAPSLTQTRNWGLPHFAAPSMTLTDVNQAPAMDKFSKTQEAKRKCVRGPALLRN